MRRVSLRLKAAVVFVLLASTPAVVTGALLVFVNSDAVETSERQLQASVLSELSSFVQLRLDSAREELVAAADVLEGQARSEAAPSLEAVRAVLGSGKHLEAARLVVPSANLSTRLFTRGNKDVPAFSGANLDAARNVDVLTTVTPSGDVLMIRHLEKTGEGGQDAFLIGSWLAIEVDAHLEETVRARFGGQDVRVAVVDEARTTLSSYGLSPSKGASLAAVSVWKLMDQGRQAHYFVTGSVEVEGKPVLAGIETLSGGFAVVMWRPEAEAYAAVTAMIQRTGLVALTTMAVALGLGLLAATRLTQPILQMAAQARAIGRRQWGDLKPLPTRNDELGELSRSLDDMAQSLESSEERIARDAKLRAELSRYMSRPLVDLIIEGEQGVSLGGKRSRVTVLFANIAAFTKLAEEGEPESIVSLLNELYSLLGEVVFRNGGVIDKFTGDGIMASWGAPTADPRHASRALEAAEDMLRFVAAASDDWERRHGVRIQLAIGINSGDCIAGNIGSNKRMEYTVIGDVVNVASLLEREAGPAQVLLTEATVEAAGEGFGFSFIGEHRISGRRGYTRVFELEVLA